MMAEKEFLDAKEKALKSLEKACNEKKVDEGILPILSLINNFKITCGSFIKDSLCLDRWGKG